MERKLAAIFSTDVAGYSRLMGDDEEATIHTLTAYRALISSYPAVPWSGGRFPWRQSVGGVRQCGRCVRCAVEIQQELKTKNIELLEHRRMQFRIGINWVNVIVEGERLYGDASTLPRGWKVWRSRRPLHLWYGVRSG